MPKIYHITLRDWFIKHNRSKQQNHQSSSKKVYFFCDEFTNYQDTEIGIKAILLLEALGYDVILPKHLESGRASISKGLLRKARKIAQHNVWCLSSLITDESPLIGIEPSAILTFRDEYLDLVADEQLESAKKLASNTFLIDEFLANEIKNGNIQKSQFSTVTKHIELHGHCQQKALNTLSATERILSFPENYSVTTIPSGCCGMAGSFGYEKEHYDLSMQIGELVLFPAIREQTSEILTTATGTSCRHQIKDGTSIKAFHPVEILYEACLLKT